MAEQKQEFDPKDLIDRKAEQEQFTDLVSFTSAARMLTICDKGGKGKSSLLKRLEYNCRYEMRPPIPVCLIELDKMEDPSAFRFIEEVVERLKKGKNKVEFPKFEDLNEARMAKNYAPFDKSNYRNRSNMTGRAEVKGPMESGAVAAGIYYNVNADSVSIPITEFSAEQEQSAQQKCIEAFFEDLRALCATRPIVLLFDTWERCNLEIRKWIIEELLENHCFNSKKSLRPAKFAIVLASRPYHPVKERSGLRDDEFTRLFTDEQECAATILSKKSLSTWEPEHVKEFLKQNSYPNASDDEIDFICNKLKAGLSFERALTIIKNLKAEE